MLFNTVRATKYGKESWSLPTQMTDKVERAFSFEESLRSLLKKFCSMLVTCSLQKRVKVCTKAKRRTFTSVLLATQSIESLLYLSTSISTTNSLQTGSTQLSVSKSTCLKKGPNRRTPRSFSWDMHGFKRREDNRRRLSPRLSSYRAFSDNSSSEGEFSDSKMLWCYMATNMSIRKTCAPSLKSVKLSVSAKTVIESEIMSRNKGWKTRRLRQSTFLLQPETRGLPSQSLRKSVVQMTAWRNMGLLGQRTLFRHKSWDIL